MIDSKRIFGVRMGLSRRHPRLLQRANFLQVWIAEAALNSSFDPLFTGRFLANNRPGSPRRAQGGQSETSSHRNPGHNAAVLRVR